jgi:hypothetical protein
MEIAKFLVDQEGGQPMMLCEKHAKMFELVTRIAEVPTTIIELEDEQIEEQYPCMACHLEDMTKPKIILPN